MTPTATKKIFLAAYRDAEKRSQIGPTLEVSTQLPSKTAVIKWLFKILALLKPVGHPVASLTTRVVRSAFTSGGLSPSGPTLPIQLLNRQPFTFAGKLTSKGSTSANILKPQVFFGALMDQVQVTDYGTVTYPSPPYKITWDDRRDGITLPKWRALIREGKNATTPMTAQRGVLAGKPGNMSVRYKRSGLDENVQTMAVAGQTTLVPPSSFTVAGLVNTLDSRALEKLHGKLYALAHDAKIGESLAEWRQAMSMIGKPLDGLRRLMQVSERRAAEVIRNAERRVGRSLSRFDARDVREVNAALASIYLEFTFGWKPLANDLHDALKAVESIRNACATVVNASFADDAIYSDDTFEDLFNNYCYFSTRAVKRVRTTVRYKVGIDPVKVVVGSYVERLGITPREFVPTLYAVLPYSWLLDYFTGINAAIDALCADLSFTTWTCRTVRNECVTEVTSNPDFARAKQALAGSFIDATGIPAVMSATLITVDRSVPDSLIPAPTVRVPKVAKPWLNITALLFQRKVASGRALAQMLSEDRMPN